MTTIATTTPLARGNMNAKHKLADGYRKPAWSEALSPSSAGSREPAHVPYVENDHDDELRYVVVLGED